MAFPTGMALPNGMVCSDGVVCSDAVVFPDLAASPFVRDNPGVCDDAIAEALKILPIALALEPGELDRLAVQNPQLLHVLRSAEYCLVEALLPLVRSQVESGEIELDTDDDFVVISANLVRQLMVKWLVVDVRAS